MIKALSRPLWNVSGVLVYSENTEVLGAIKRDLNEVKEYPEQEQERGDLDLLYSMLGIGKKSDLKEIYCDLGVELEYKGTILVGVWWPCFVDKIDTKFLYEGNLSLSIMGGNQLALNRIRVSVGDRFLHRVILGLPKNKPVVDFINRFPFVCTRRNLSVTDQSVNMGRQAKQFGKEGFVGVSFDKSTGYWYTTLTVPVIATGEDVMVTVRVSTPEYGAVLFDYFKKDVLNNPYYRTQQTVTSLGKVIDSLEEKQLTKFLRAVWNANREAYKVLVASKNIAFKYDYVTKRKNYYSLQMFYKGKSKSMRSQSAEDLALINDYIERHYFNRKSVLEPSGLYYLGTEEEFLTLLGSYKESVLSWLQSIVQIS